MTITTVQYRPNRIHKVNIHSLYKRIVKLKVFNCFYRITHGNDSIPRFSERWIDVGFVDDETVATQFSRVGVLDSCNALREVIGSTTSRICSTTISELVSDCSIGPKRNSRPYTRFICLVIQILFFSPLFALTAAHWFKSLEVRRCCVK